MQEHSNEPVFFDKSRKRGRALTALAVALAALSLAATVLFVATILVMPAAQFKTLPSSVRAAPDLDGGNALPANHKPLTPIARAELRYVIAKNAPITEAKRKLADNIRAEQNTAARAIPAETIAPGRITGPVRAAFYVNSEQQSLESLEQHIGETTHFMPQWLHLSPSGGDTVPDIDLGTRKTAASAQSDDDSGSVGPTYDQIALSLARRDGVAIVPMIQNAYGDNFHENNLHALLTSPVNRAKVIGELLGFVVKGGYQGINIDFETDNAADCHTMTAFMTELGAAFHAKNLLVTQDIQLDSATYDLPALSRIDDFLVPMIYDENADGTPAGPIASQSWFNQELHQFLAQVPANRTVIGLGNYGYDWKQGSTAPDDVSFEDATQIANESIDGEDGHIRIDRQSLNPYFTYWDADGKNGATIKHQVWMEDATTAYNELRAASGSHVLGAALWRLGTEDPSLWDFFGKSQAASLTQFNPQALASVTYDGFGTDFQGQGDVLDVIGLPHPGIRTIVANRATGLISAENFLNYPSRYVIRRTGLVDQESGLNVQKKIALTFDDGPDPHWTPLILDILHENHVPATFFVVGENAEAHPGLVEREWQMGMEIGNHSYTHPEMETISPLRTKLELDATQRVIEAITGHRTTLFRAPNRADSEPSTPADLEPVLDASKLGYVFIGEQIDPRDWRPGVKWQEIVYGAHGVLASANQGNCILMHDAGGLTREQTVIALPIIIRHLKAEGYTFVTVSQLMGRSRAQVFPLVPARQELEVRFDRAIFTFAYWAGQIFTAIFIIAVALGITRTLLMGALALMQSRKENDREADFAAAQAANPNLNLVYAPQVSVVIAAYNEAKVINSTIATLLAGDYPNLEIVVVDDGSKDDTAEVVRAKYGGDARLTILTKPNGGKASALNLGIKECQGEIVVALDADTVFAPDTISRLVRHFADPTIGAVSGNVKVGNRRNALTAWQAVEYITSQNFDRRAFDALNCITVVPGAIGAWRKDAIILAGLYSSATLAEDTDLTFKVRRLGYKIVTDSTALAYTEAPDTVHDLAKQRFRWAFGTLQCLWKHRDALLKPKWGTFGMVAMPSLWIYQIGFQAIAPIVDITILWSLLYSRFIAPTSDNHNIIMLASYWLAFSVVELIGAGIAFRLDKENMRLLAWLPLQRFGYRQIMYYVIVKSIWAAARGSIVGWGKLERKGTNTLPPQQAPVARHSGAIALPTIQSGDPEPHGAEQPLLSERNQQSG